MHFDLPFWHPSLLCILLNVYVYVFLSPHHLRMPYNCSICSCKLVTEALTFDLELTGILLLPLTTTSFCFVGFSGLPLQPESCTCAWCLSKRFPADIKYEAEICVWIVCPCTCCRVSLQLFVIWERIIFA